MDGKSIARQSWSGRTGLIEGRLGLVGRGAGGTGLVGSGEARKGSHGMALWLGTGLVYHGMAGLDEAVKSWLGLSWRGRVRLWQGKAWRSRIAMARRGV